MTITGVKGVVGKPPFFVKELGRFIGIFSLWQLEASFEHCAFIAYQ